MAKLAAFLISFVVSVLALTGFFWSIFALQMGSHWLMNKVVADCAGQYCSTDVIAVTGVLVVISFMVVSILLASIATLIWSLKLSETLIERFTGEK